MDAQLITISSVLKNNDGYTLYGQKSQSSFHNPSIWIRKSICSQKLVRVLRASLPCTGVLITQDKQQVMYLCGYAFTLVSDFDYGLQYVFIAVTKIRRIR